MPPILVDLLCRLECAEAMPINMATAAIIAGLRQQIAAERARTR